MPNPLERFTAEYFTLNSISKQRRSQVLTALRRLDAFLEQPLEEATSSDLREWMVSLLDNGLQPSTVAWHLRAIKPFYRWCWNHELLDSDQWTRLREVSPPRGARVVRPRPYNHKELQVLWARLDARWPYTTPLIIQRWQNGTSPWRSVRKHAMRLQLNAIIELALVCGLRRIEIYRLSIDDCHWDNKYIVVHGKRVDQNPKVREVPYPDSTRMAIRAWFRWRGLMSPEPGLPLWLSITGPDPAAPLNFTRMARILHTLGPWQLHRLRHTCATERLRAGMELETLREFLGHSSINQTLAYAQLIRSDIHKASERIDADFQQAIRPAA